MRTEELQDCNCGAFDLCTTYRSCNYYLPCVCVCVGGGGRGMGGKGDGTKLQSIELLV